MAAQANLNVLLSADGRQLIKTMQEAEAEVKALQKQLLATKDASIFKGLSAQLNKAKSDLKSLKSVAENSGLNKLSKASVDATGDLINLGRVVQDAPFGFLGIANNLNPLFEGFGRTAKAAGGFGATLKAVGKSLVGAGGLSLAVSAVSTALILFGDSLFSGSNAMKGFNRELYDLEEAGKAAKESIKDLNSEIDFLTSAATGVVDINLGSGFDRDLRKAQFERQALFQKQNKLLEEEKAAFDRNSAAISNFTKNASAGALAAANSFSDLALVPQEVVDNFSKADKKNIEAAKRTSDELISIQQERAKISEQIVLKNISIRGVEAEEQRRLAKEQADAYKKYVDDTISKAKDLADFFDKTTIRQFRFEVDPTESIDTTLRKALEFISRASTSAGRLTFPFKFDVFFNTKTDLTDGIIKEFDKAKGQVPDLLGKFQKEIDRLTAENPILIRFKLINEEDKKALEDAIKAINVGVATQGINALGNAFESFFSAITSGGSPLKAFFQSLTQQVGQLIARLAAAAAVAGILNALLGGKGFLGAKGFSAIFAKIAGFRADGGPVQAGKTYVVGERGPEMFVPKTSGRILPNDQMARGGVSMQAAPAQTVVVQGVLSGRDIRLINARQQGYENRNV